MTSKPIKYELLSEGSTLQRHVFEICLGLKVISDRLQSQGFESDAAEVRNEIFRLEAQFRHLNEGMSFIEGLRQLQTKPNACIYLMDLEGCFRIKGDQLFYENAKGEISTAGDLLTPERLRAKWLISYQSD